MIIAILIISILTLIEALVNGIRYKILAKATLETLQSAIEEALKDD